MERRMDDPGDPQLPRGQFERRFVGNGAEDEVGMVAVGGDDPETAGLQGGVDALDGLLGRREVGPDDRVDVSDLPHHRNAP